MVFFLRCVFRTKISFIRYRKYREKNERLPWDNVVRFAAQLFG